jgi:hypothetical protein
MGTVKKPRKESGKATLSRIQKEMAQPRIAKSARNKSEPGHTRVATVINHSSYEFSVSDDSK